MTDAIDAYHARFEGPTRAVLERLRTELDAGLPDAEARVWHGHPVWFLAGNPVAGYSVLKSGPRLLFWSGRSFEEPALRDEGSFQAAEARFAAPDDIDLPALRRWIGKSRDIQWDYKNIVKRKGRLERLA